jgi:hypothetical protein
MDQRLLAAPHGFSQRATSFIASWCQGIHRTPLSCSSSRDHGSEEPDPTLHRNHPTSDLPPGNCPIQMPHQQNSCENNHPPARTHNAHPVSHLRFCATKLRGFGLSTSSGQTCNLTAQMRQTLIHDLKNIFIRTRRRKQHTTKRVRTEAQTLDAMISVPPRRWSPLVEVDGIEPTTPCLQSRCSPTELHPPGDNQ